MVFANKYILLLFIFIIPYIIWYVYKHNKIEPSLRLSDISHYLKVNKSWKQYLVHMPFLLKIVSFSMIILILARPQSTDNWENTEIEGIDIMMAIDISTSMLAEDLSPNRLDAAKKVAAEFINDRPNDNIGLTVFAGESFTQCPLTVNHEVLLNLFGNIRCGLINDGTAIGVGVANAVSRLKDSKAKSKVIILLTDGTNNAGDISPLMAAEIAKKYGIRIYTIGVGTNGSARYPYPTAFGVRYVNIPVEIDEDMLKGMASMTDGVYYRATSNSKLKEIYNEIDKLEKTKLNVKEFSKKNEEYQIFALILLLSILVDILLRSTILKRVA